MAEMIAGFELREGVKITDLDSWPSFAEWHQDQHGYAPNPKNFYARQRFEAYLAGAHWQWERSAFGRVNAPAVEGITT